MSSLIKSYEDTIIRMQKAIDSLRDMINAPHNEDIEIEAGQLMWRHSKERGASVGNYDAMHWEICRALAAERERCAKIAEKKSEEWKYDLSGHEMADNIANSIRRIKV